MDKTIVYCLEMYLTFEFEIVILHGHVSFRESNCFFFSLSIWSFGMHNMDVSLYDVSSISGAIGEPFV